MSEFPNEHDVWTNGEEFDEDILPIDLFDDPDWEQFHLEQQIEQDDEEMKFIQQYSKQIDDFF